MALRRFKLEGGSIMRERILVATLVSAFMVAAVTPVSAGEYMRSAAALTEKPLTVQQQDLRRPMAGDEAGRQAWGDLGGVSP
jgi:hypothetical protein